jgi:glycosyltransferase involved in cell wall biosynthesis
MRPRISVLLPVWNAAASLATCLHSIARQSEPDWECIVLDDGSTDDPLAVARAFADRDPRFRIEARAHEGIVPTLGAGAALCSAPVIARMDADDWMHRDRLALQLAALDRAPELAAVGCPVRIFPRRGLSEGRRRYEAWLNSLPDAGTIWRERFIECPIAHPTLAIRRERLLEVGYRDRGWPEDYDLILRLLRDGPCIGTLDRRLLGWRDQPNRLSRMDARYSLEQFMACRAWHLSRDFLTRSESYILWGHGRTGRALRKALALLGHHPSTIVEVHPRRIGKTIRNAAVIGPEDLPSKPSDPIVVSVAGARPRGEIRAAMLRMGFVEGERYVCAA